MMMMDLEQSFPNSQFSNTHKQQQQRKAWVSESWLWMLIVIVITHRLIVIVIIVITHLVQNCLLHIIVKLRSCHHANVIIIGDRNIKKMYFFLQSEVILKRVAACKMVSERYWWHLPSRLMLWSLLPTSRLHCPVSSSSSKMREYKSFTSSPGSEINQEALGTGWLNILSLKLLKILSCLCCWHLWWI